MTKEQGIPFARIGVRGLDASNLVLSDPVLARSSFVLGLGDSAEPVLPQGRACRIRPEGVVFAAGQTAGSVILVAAGELEIRATGTVGDLVAGLVPAGEITGAEAALGEATRLCTAIATGLAVVVEIPIAAFLAFVTEGSPLANCLQEAFDRDARAASDMGDFLDRW